MGCQPQNNTIELPCTQPEGCQQSIRVGHEREGHLGKATLEKRDRLRSCFTKRTCEARVASAFWYTWERRDVAIASSAAWGGAGRILLGTAWSAVMTVWHRAQVYELEQKKRNTYEVLIRDKIGNSIPLSECTKRAA